MSLCLYFLSCGKLKVTLSFFLGMLGGQVHYYHQSFKIVLPEVQKGGVVYERPYGHRNRQIELGLSNEDPPKKGKVSVYIDLFLIFPICNKEHLPFLAIKYL